MIRAQDLSYSLEILAEPHRGLTEQMANASNQGLCSGAARDCGDSHQSIYHEFNAADRMRVSFYSTGNFGRGTKYFPKKPCLNTLSAGKRN